MDTTPFTDTSDPLEIAPMVISSCQTTEDVQVAATSRWDELRGEGGPA
jgi:hypothetical protein